MTDIIIKKGSGVPPKASLKEAELALDVIGGDLYSKMQDGSVRRLTGGDGTGAGMVISPTEPAEDERVTGLQWLDSTTGRGGCGTRTSGLSSQPTYLPVTALALGTT